MRGGSILVPGESAGPIRIGMTLTGVEAVLGEPDERSEFEEDRMVYLSYFRLGLCVRIIEGTVEGVLLYSGRLGGHETMKWDRFEGAFDCGLDLDSNAKDVIEQLGPPEFSGRLPDAPIPSSWISYTSRGVGFDFIEATGEMIYITIFAPRPLPNDEQ
ncbi:MAG: hypothetical protein NW223_15390 [Hyphomicrobiaceae bacterium]|nr:hypothetical protein [Hyphomicrobiaceae bacterium]